MGLPSVRVWRGGIRSIDHPGFFWVFWGFQIALVWGGYQLVERRAALPDALAAVTTWLDEYAVLAPGWSWREEALGFVVGLLVSAFVILPIVRIAVQKVRTPDVEWPTVDPAPGPDEENTDGPEPDGHMGSPE